MYSAPYLYEAPFHDNKICKFVLSLSNRVSDRLIMDPTQTVVCVAVITV